VPVAKNPAILRITGTILRAVFIIVMVAVTLRVSMPQNETVWTAWDTPSDLVRMAMGIVVCIWLVIQVFRMPKNVADYRTWLYLGLAAVPFAVICLIAVW
jgi:TRAP-type C4-dicarboxylate transport system permease small subunit